MRSCINNAIVRPATIKVIMALMVAAFAGRSAPAADESAARCTAHRSKYLLVDSRVVDKTENARLTLGTVKKHPNNPLFTEDKPWEKRFDNLYGNVLYDQDEKLYKCWYSPFIVDHSAKGMSLEERKKDYRPRTAARWVSVTRHRKTAFAGRNRVSAWSSMTAARRTTSCGADRMEPAC